MLEECLQPTWLGQCPANLAPSIVPRSSRPRKFLDNKSDMVQGVRGAAAQRAYCLTMKPAKRKPHGIQHPRSRTGENLKRIQLSWLL